MPETIASGVLSSSNELPSDTEESDALHRCLTRELATASTLLRQVRGDLCTVESLCRGQVKATNEVGSARDADGLL